jgi:hypothetical protein
MRHVSGMLNAIREELGVATSGIIDYAITWMI